MPLGALQLGRGDGECLSLEPGEGFESSSGLEGFRALGLQGFCSLPLSLDEPALQGEPRYV